MSGDLRRQPLVPKAHPASEIPDPPQRAPLTAAPEPAPEPEPAAPAPIDPPVPPHPEPPARPVAQQPTGKTKQHNVDITEEMYKAIYRAVAMRNAEAGEKVSTLRSWTIEAMQEKLDRDAL